MKLRWAIYTFIHLYTPNTPLYTYIHLHTVTYSYIQLYHSYIQLYTAISQLYTVNYLYNSSVTVSYLLHALPLIIICFWLCFLLFCFFWRCVAMTAVRVDAMVSCIVGNFRVNQVNCVYNEDDWAFLLVFRGEQTELVSVEKGCLMKNKNWIFRLLFWSRIPQRH